MCVWFSERLIFDEFSIQHIIIIIIKIIIIIIALKGAIQDFLQSPHSAANCLRHARCIDVLCLYVYHCTCIYHKWM